MEQTNTPQQPSRKKAILSLLGVTVSFVIGRIERKLLSWRG